MRRSAVNSDDLRPTNSKGTFKLWGEKPSMAQEGAHACLSPRATELIVLIFICTPFILFYFIFCICSFVHLFFDLAFRSGGAHWHGSIKDIPLYTIASYETQLFPQTTY
jgi:hypothetical protein